MTGSKTVRSPECGNADSIVNGNWKETFDGLNKAHWDQILAAGRDFLETSGIAEYDLDAWYLFSHVFHMDKAHYYLRGRDVAEVSGEDLSRYMDLLLKRAGRTPLQHILGTQDFMGLTFFVNEHVLIPRQDTETLVETVLSENTCKELSVLDMCTGSGCIAVSLAALGGYRTVEGADISEPALAVAERNARQILKDRTGAMVKFRHSDLFSGFSKEERYDLIVSNPPYIPTKVIEGLEPEVRDFEPKNALDGSEDGLSFYRRLAGESPSYLNEGGRVYFEIGYDQGQAVSDLLAANGFSRIRVIKDLAGKDRVVCAEKAGAADFVRQCMKQEV